MHFYYLIHMCVSNIHILHCLLHMSTAIAGNGQEAHIGTPTVSHLEVMSFLELAELICFFSFLFVAHPAPSGKIGLVKRAQRRTTFLQNVSKHWQT